MVIDMGIILDRTPVITLMITNRDMILDPILVITKQIPTIMVMTLVVWTTILIPIVLRHMVPKTPHFIKIHPHFMKLLLHHIGTPNRIFLMNHIMAEHQQLNLYHTEILNIQVNIQKGLL